MIFLVEIPDVMQEVLNQIRQEARMLVCDIIPSEALRQISSGTDLISSDCADTGFYLIRDGAVRLECDGRSLAIFEKDDLVGAEQLKISSSDSAFGYTYRADFGVIADHYSWSDFSVVLSGDRERIVRWTRYLSLQSKLYQLLAAHMSQAEAPFVPDFLTFDEGDVIIAEGTESDGVYTMLSGSALVSVKGLKVGEILADEIFGAIAALTSGTRSATVTAQESCSVIRVEGAHFERLLRARPDTVNRLVRDLARSVVSGNEKLLEFSRGELKSW